MDATNITSQRAYARLAGAMYLLVLVAAVFASFYIRANLIVWGDAAETASRIASSPQLLRIGLAFDLTSFAGIVVLALALYRTVSPINQGMALLSLFWWLGEAFILAATALNDFIVLTLLGDARYLSAFEPEQLQALAMVFAEAHLTGYNIGLLFFGLGSITFSYLLFAANYVPRILALFGVLASTVLLVGTFVILVAPQYESLAYSFVNPPMALYELLIGAWLLAFGIRVSAR